MSEERQEQEPQIEAVCDPRTGREVARFDRATERLRVKHYRDHAVWINIRDLLDKKPAR